MNRLFIVGLTLFGLTTGLLLTACQSITNYTAPDGPLFTGVYADTPPGFSGAVRVITWNIKFGENIDTAITELTEVETLQEADFILLQEMDEGGVEKLAQTLQYNYVYFPASVHTHHHRNFGNAILSKWPLSHPAKLILPHKNPKNDQIRIAARAVAAVGRQEILIYSVHTETFWLEPAKRYAQFDALAADMDDRYDTVIVGGDFNTLTAGSIEILEERLAQAQLKRMSSNAGVTFTGGDMDLISDHIFARGMTALETAAWPHTQASDHFPVWVLLSID